MNVLIIDRCPSICDLYTHLFISNGCDVSSTCGTLKHIERVNYSLVLVDLFIESRKNHLYVRWLSRMENFSRSVFVYTNVDGFFQVKNYGEIEIPKPISISKVTWLIDSLKNNLQN